MIFQTLSDGEKAVLRLLFADFVENVIQADGIMEESEEFAKYDLLNIDYKSNIVDGTVKSIAELLENNISIDSGQSTEQLQYRASIILDKFDEKEQQEFLLDYLFVGKHIASIDGHIDIRERAVIINYFEQLGWGNLNEHLLSEWQLDDHRLDS